VGPQPGQPTVAQELTTVVTAAFSQPLVALAWAARTDAGVHARANVFSFRLRDPVDPEALRVALEQRLPPDVTVCALSVVPRSFHARASALGKHYRYRMVVGLPLAGLEHRAWHVAVPLDVRAMQELASWLPGTRDWSALRHPRCSANSRIKTVGAVSVRARSSGASRLILVDVTGDGFLRQMVRIMVGTLALVGTGWLSVEDAREAIRAGHRDGAGPSAPAHGLTLMRVEY